MARQLRLSFENAVYYITTIGVRGKNIYYSNKDKHVFIKKMNEAFEKYSFTCYAYCLADNHYHLFIKTPFANISEGMHYLNTSYANWFKTKYEIKGSVFQGRYRAVLVDTKNYALNLSAYIHLNPSRRGTVRILEDYPFSSLQDYIYERETIVNRLDTSLIFNMLSNNEIDAKEQYSQYINENYDIADPLKNSYMNTALGNRSFIERIKEKIRLLSQHSREISRIKKMNMLNGKQIIKDVTKQFNIKKGSIFKKKRDNIYRKLTLYLLKKYSALSLKEIGELFNMDYSAVSQSAKRFEKEIKSNKADLQTVEKILKHYPKETL